MQLTYIADRVVIFVTDVIIAWPDEQFARRFGVQFVEYNTIFQVNATTCCARLCLV